MSRKYMVETTEKSRLMVAQVRMLKDIPKTSPRPSSSPLAYGISPQPKLEETLPKPKSEKRTFRNKLNDLSGREWIKGTSTVWFQKGLGKNHPHAEIEREHPAPFSFQDIMKLINFFTKANNIVLDPFCGVASTLKACALTGRKGIGIELIRKWAQLGKRRLRKETTNPSHQRIIIGDARKKLPKIAGESIDYIVTSPPYWRILGKKPDHKMRNERLANGYVTKYSDDARDLGNIEDYTEFLAQLKICFSECFRVLKRGKYASIIVSDFRHKSTYQPYHVDIIRIMEESGFRLKGIAILVQNSKTLYPYGYPYAYVPNIHHQYILTFQKPNGESRKNDSANVS